MNSEKNKNKIFLIGLGLIALVVVITIARNSIEISKKNDSDEVVAPQPEDNTTYIIPKALYQKTIQKQEDFFIIDIRDRQSYLDEHIENAVNIPIESLYQEHERINKDKNIIIIGESYSDKEILSELFDFLTEKKFENVQVVSGGMLGWKNAHLPTISLGDPNSFEDHSKINYLEPLQLDIAIKNNYPSIILDVRSAAEFRQGHIPSAINIPANELEKRSEEIKKTKELVVYSGSELKDFQIAGKLHDMGYLATYILKGGLNAWKEKNLEIVQ